jgi:hypothetical protein
VTFALASFALVAAIVGAMLFFAGAVAPTVFRVLQAAEAGRFLRAQFRVYYLVLGIATLAAALLAAAAGRWREAALIALVAAGFALARQGLMPRINALRDRALAGDAAAEPAFQALHRTSVWLNAFQLLGLLAVAWLLAG